MTRGSALGHFYCQFTCSRKPLAKELSPSVTPDHTLYQAKRPSNPSFLICLITIMKNLSIPGFLLFISVPGFAQNNVVLTPNSPTPGSNNTLVGFNVGASTTGSQNVMVGYQAGPKQAPAGRALGGAGGQRRRRHGQDGRQTPGED